ncbi:MAG: cobalamin-dependent protein [Candidatus Omnitrophica bacterium]|nr:cobalamin-dependent protein [Candidatus Omnitrophota bacterium]MDD5670271.1 cobalamin-dependent protein [Candidatus Omnitrophota bacterium]
MKILLVHPQINSIPAYSYGIGYLISVLKRGGHSADYFVLQDLRDILLLYQTVKEQKPDIIGFSLLTAEAGYLGDIIKGVKEISSALIVCGGIHPTLQPESTSQIDGVDAIVRGEGEYPLLELANCMEKKEGYFHLKNFWFKKNGQIIKNDLRPLIDLNELPPPDKGIFYQRMIDLDWGTNRFMFNRGCPFGCSYCSNSALQMLYKSKGPFCRFLSPQKAIELIDLDSKRFKFDFIFFDDDIIALDKNWFYEFFALYKKRFSYPFCCNVRAGSVDSAMI